MQGRDTKYIYKGVQPKTACDELRSILGQVMSNSKGHYKFQRAKAACKLDMVVDSRGWWLIGNLFITREEFNRRAEWEEKNKDTYSFRS